jgi:hypothetical protein
VERVVLNALANSPVWSGAPQTRKVNQSPPLKPAEPKNTEQPAHDGRRLRNYGAIQLDVVDDRLVILAI